MNTVREIDLESLVLYRGGHADSENELALKMCVMEAVAFVAGEPWSDHPECACPVLGCFLRNWNDSLDDATRQRLKPYIPRLVGTKDGNSERRSWMCMDWLTRECGPAFMDLTPELRSHAAALRALPEITKVSLESAMVTLAAARDAARDAVARDAAAARAAAWKPTVLKLQESAFRLLDRMLDLPAQDAAATRTQRYMLAELLKRSLEYIKSRERCSKTGCTDPWCIKKNNLITEIQAALGFSTPEVKG